MLTRFHLSVSLWHNYATVFPGRDISKVFLAQSIDFRSTVALCSLSVALRAAVWQQGILLLGFFAHKLWKTLTSLII